MASKPKTRKEEEIRRVVRDVLEEDRKTEEEARKRLAIYRKYCQVKKAAREPVSIFCLTMLLVFECVPLMKHWLEVVDDVPTNPDI